MDRGQSPGRISLVSLLTETSPRNIRIISDAQFLRKGVSKILGVPLLAVSVLLLAIWGVLLAAGSIVLVSPVSLGLTIAALVCAAIVVIASLGTIRRI
jgi:hypothetical protein